MATILPSLISFRVVLDLIDAKYKLRNEFLIVYLLTLANLSGQLEV